jgi:hypothetical protein
LIDWGFEDRLIDRIAAREAIAARLTPRQRRVMARTIRYGETTKEVGKREGCSATRINQIVSRSVDRLRGACVERPIARAAPQQTTRATPPTGFDKATFLRHMQGLIVQREAVAREAFQRERRMLDALLAQELPKPVYLTTPKHIHVAPPPPPPPAPLGAFQLQFLARLAVVELTHLLGPTRQPGMPTLGARNNSVSYHTQAGTMQTAIRQLLDSLPSGARLSACLFPTSWPGACAANEYAAVNVMGGSEGCLQLDVSWDEGIA